METNIAAWMIGGGRKDDPADLRDQMHIRAIRDARRERQTLPSRLAAFVAAARPSRAIADPACCAA
jgi:hypothetical protein